MQNGFAVIHANHLEDLTDITVQWLRDNPLAPLEEEVFLVQSNGMAQWLKLRLAADDACGIAAAQQFQMPQRFLWQAYRTVLGEQEVPRTSPFDKSRLIWRLMRLLPEMLDDPAFVSLQRFLAEGDNQRKRYQLAERLADLFDQYQVYRADWLEDWENGDDQLRKANDQPRPLSDDERWQAILWRRLVDDMSEEHRETSRAKIHRRFIDRLDGDGTPAELPRRIVVFGISSLPQQALEALHALSRHCQILMLVQNPCRHYWADIVEDRVLLRDIRQNRHADKPELSAFDADEMHRHANPLLAAWGKQGRDYIGQLYHYDVPEQYREWFNEIDAFEAVAAHHRAPDSLLADIQQAILDLDPLPGPEEAITRQPDASLAFHVAHSPQREVEILHDQLLKRFRDADGDLRPRDVIVMVPDIQTYAPHIEAVFGNLNESDPRHIPYTISDRSQRHTLPLAIALENLLDLPQSRFTVGNLLDLLEVPALRQRFGLHEEDLPLLHRWIHGAGVRWGLHAQQRASLGLPGDFEQNSWWFGLKRMLLGYAVGAGEHWHGIEPYDEVGGLEAALAGRLTQLLEALERQWRALSDEGTPQDWVERLGDLMTSLFELRDTDDMQLESTLLESLEQWKDACDEAGFDEALPLAVAREAWLSALEQSSLSQRFLAGRVNFCTLMPMRSIPFRQVCLLGMNDGDYPRSQTPLDFDLMARREQYRPGDRSRREDDRYLFLEALLSAREQLHISWVGRNVRDNEPRPPSVLVAQLRDYVESGWQQPDKRSLLEALTVVHPLQPFSTRYFDENEKDRRLFSFAEEWSAAHSTEAQFADNRALPAPVFEETPVLTPPQLARFLKQPAALFFNDRLKVRFRGPDVEAEDTEPFSLDGLDSYQITEALLDAARHAPAGERLAAMEAVQQRLHRAGQVPLAVFGENQLATIADKAETTVNAWDALRCNWREHDDIEEVQLSLETGSQPVNIEHWLTDLLVDDNGHYARIMMLPNALNAKPWNALPAWTVHLTASAAGLTLTTVLVSGETQQCLPPLPAEEARRHLQAMLDAWHQGLCAPLPVACRTAFHFLAEHKRGKNDPLIEAQTRYDGGFKDGEVSYSAELSRAFPCFDDLLDADGPGDFQGWVDALYAPLFEQLRDLEEGDLS